MKKALVALFFIASLSILTSALINYPPSAPTSLFCNDSPCYENRTFSEYVNLKCSGSEDPEGNDITYFIEAFYNKGQPTNYFLDEFNNSLKGEEIILPKNGFIVRYLKLPLDAEVISADIEFEGKDNGNTGIAKDILYYYRFDEGYGNTSYDRIQGTELTLVDIDDSNWVDGKLGKAIQFNGNPEHGYNNEFPSTLTNNGFTMQAWVEPGYFDPNGAIAGFYSMQDFGWLSLAYHDYEYRMGFWLYNSGNDRVAFSNSLSSGAWNHLVGVHDGRELRIYLNGQLNQVTGINAGEFNNPYLFAIGTSYPYKLRYFYGKIDEVAIWNRSLSQEEIQSLYYNYIGIFSFPLNPYLEIGNLDGNHEWNYSSLFNISEQTEDFSDSLNIALNNGACDCEGCQIEENSCLIPFTFHSDSDSSLRYFDIDVDYSLSGKMWGSLGSHEESSSLNWDLNNLRKQSGVELRCRANDLFGSGDFSDYYDSGASITLHPQIYQYDSSGEMAKLRNITRI